MPHRVHYTFFTKTFREQKQIENVYFVLNTVNSDFPFGLSRGLCIMIKMEII